MTVMVLERRENKVERKKEKERKDPQKATSLLTSHFHDA